MKTNKLFLGIRALVLSAAVLAAGFFAVQPPKAYAACSYDIQFGSDKYSATTSDTLNLRAVLTRSGTIGSCSDSVRFNMTLSIPERSTLSYSQNSNFNGDTAVGNFTIQISNLGLTSGAGQLAFHASAWDGLSRLQQSSPIIVNVSGISSSQGSANVQVVVEPVKATYSKNDNVNVKVTSGNLASVAGSSVTSAYLALYVNGSNSPVRGFSQNVSAFTNPQYFHGVVVDSGTGFRDGSNSVVVKLFASGTNLELGSGTLNVQAQGIGAATTGTQNNATGTGTQNTTGNGTQNVTGNGTQNNVNATSNMATFPRIIDDPDLLSLFLRLLRLAMSLLGVFSVLMIVYGGFRMTLSRGNDEAYTAGRKTVTYAIIGLIVALLSFAMIAIVQNIIGADVPSAADQIKQNP